MSLAEMKQIASTVTTVDGSTFTLLAVCLFFARLLFTKLRGKSHQEISLQLQENRRNIKFKGPALIATLIIFLNYFKSNRKS